MTNEEAIAYLKGQRACICSEDCNNPYDFYLCEQGFLCNDVEAINMAISALEKQIPKKPIRINKNKEFDGNWKKICPSCGSMLTERITTPERSFPRHYNYTQHCWCGQAIDWTEGEG